MKTIKTGIILMVLSCSYLTSFGQKEIFGQWKASCYLERNPDGSLAFCSICPTQLESKELKINDFELEINNQILKIVAKGNSTNLDYTWDSTMEAISFEYEKTKYSFKVLRGTSATNCILKDNKGGGLLLLTKK